MEISSQCYHYSFEKDPTTESNEAAAAAEDDDPQSSAFTTIKFQFWKFNTSLNNVVKLGQTKFYIRLGQLVVVDEDMNMALKDCIRDLGVPEVCHARMISLLMSYIASKRATGGWSKNERQIFLMDIVEAECMVEGLRIDEALVRWMDVEGVERFFEPGRRFWNVMDFGKGVSGLWEWSLSHAEGDVMEVNEVVRGLEDYLELNFSDGEVEEECIVEEVMSEEEVEEDVIEDEGDGSVVTETDLDQAMLMTEITDDLASSMFEDFLYEMEQDDMVEAVNQSIVEYPWSMVPASEAAIESLEKVLEGEVDGFSCVICMGDDENEEEVGLSRMPCAHLFHTRCLQTWLRISSYCPLCKFVLH